MDNKDPSSSQTSVKHLRQGRWSPEEHKLFLEGLVLYSNEWKRVQEHIGTRSSTQSRSHAQKFFIRIRSKLSHIHSKKEIKEKIYQHFAKQLNSRTLIKDSHVFRDKMYELIFSHESSLTPNQHNYQVKNRCRKYAKKSSVDADTMRKRLGHNSHKKKEIFTIYKDGLHKLTKHHDNVNSITLSHSKDSNNAIYKLYTLINERPHIVNDTNDNMNILTTPNTKHDGSSSTSCVMNQLNLFSNNNNLLDTFEFNNHNSHESIYSYGYDNNIDYLNKSIVFWK